LPEFSCYDFLEYPQYAHQWLRWQCSFSNCQLYCWGFWRFCQHPECSNISRVDKSDANQSGNPLSLHTLQREAILTAKEEKKSYVLASGTGSGTSLADSQLSTSRGVAFHSIAEKRIVRQCLRSVL